MPISCDSKKDNPPSVQPRFCCMLSTYHDIFEEIDVLKYRWGDPGGVMYTCNAGFLDFGHLFDFAEITTYYHHFLTKGGANVPGKSFAGFWQDRVTIKSNIAASDRPTVAASITFDFSVFYEIMTYWVSGPGKHNSSFSPEDLVSNYIGVRVAERAVRNTGMNISLAIRKELKAVLPLLGPRDTFQSQAAYAAIDGIWVKHVGGLIGFAFEDDDYLLRRNLNYRPISPCYVTAAGTGCTGSPAFPSDLGTSFPDNIRDSYDMEFTVWESEAQTRLGKKVKRADFPRLVADIRADSRVGNLCP